MNNREIRIICSTNVSPELLYYIADNWVEFVTQDIGLMPSDLLMILPL